MSEQFEEYISDCLTAWKGLKQTDAYKEYLQTCTAAWNKYLKEDKT